MKMVLVVFLFESIKLRWEYALYVQMSIVNHLEHDLDSRSTGYKKEVRFVSDGGGKGKYRDFNLDPPIGRQVGGWGNLEIRWKTRGKK